MVVTVLATFLLLIVGFPVSHSLEFDISAANYTSAEHVLFIHLFKGYNRHIRPVIGHSRTDVFFELSLFNVLTLDTKKQELLINSEMIMQWRDHYLTWDPDDYNGTLSIRVPYTDIWFPDVILYNTADSNYAGSIINTNAIVMYTGDVELVSHALFTSVCNVDVQWYPFDQQVCSLTFASWTYDKTKIRLLLGEPDLSDFTENPEYFLENFWAEQEDIHQPCCPIEFSAAKYHIQLQRRTIFSLFFFIMPGILINICAVMVFSLPAEAGEKVGLGINSMLAMMVFLMAMTENLPPTQKLPLAGVYYGTCITMITFNIMFSVAVMNLNVMGMRGYHVPEFLQNLTLFVARVILVRIPKVVQRTWDLDNGVKVSPMGKMKDDGVRVFNVQPQNQKQMPQKMEKKGILQLEDDEDFSQMKDPFQRRTVAALESINHILAREETSTSQNNSKSDLVEQWKFVSRVLDRTLFIVFTIICIIFNLVILTSSPFRERFDFCPFPDKTICEDLEMEEIIELQSSAADSHHGAVGGDFGAPDGGHGAVAAHLFAVNPILNIYETEATAQDGNNNAAKKAGTEMHDGKIVDLQGDGNGSGDKEGTAGDDRGSAIATEDTRNLDPDGTMAPGTSREEMIEEAKDKQRKILVARRNKHR